MSKRRPGGPGVEITLVTAEDCHLLAKRHQSTIFEVAHLNPLLSNRRVSAQELGKFPFLHPWQRLMGASSQGDIGVPLWSAVVLASYFDKGGRSRSVYIPIDLVRCRHAPQPGEKVILTGLRWGELDGGPVVDWLIRADAPHHQKGRGAERMRKRKRAARRRHASKTA